MVSSFSKRVKRKDKSNNTQRSRSTSQTSKDSDDSYFDDSAITYRVRENSKGELVHMDIPEVVWPTRVIKAVRELPGSSPLSSDTDYDSLEEPYKGMTPEERAAAIDADARAHEEAKRAMSKQMTSEELCAAIEAAPELSSPLTDEELNSRFPELMDESRIDSAVFDTAEELRRYQHLFRKMDAAPRSDASSVSRSAVTSQRDDTERHYIGVCSRRAVEKKLKPGHFYIYYDKPSGEEIPVTIDLKIGYMTSSSKIHHYPIQRYQCQGEPCYAVVQSDTDVKMFSSIAALVHHYHTFAHVDPESGSLETFGPPPM